MSAASQPAATAPPQITPAERDHARADIEKSFTGVREAVAGLSHTQLQFAPASDCWSIAQILEHLTLVQQAVLHRVLEGLAQVPASENPDAAVIDALIPQRFPLREGRFSSPEAAIPKAGLEPAAALQRMTENCSRMLDVLNTSGYLRGHLLPSPPLKAMTQGKYQMMDGYQWLIALAAHNMRHTGQIQEWKANPEFAAQ